MKENFFFDHIFHFSDYTRVQFKLVSLDFTVFCDIEKSRPKGPETSSNQYFKLKAIEQCIFYRT